MHRAPVAAILLGFLAFLPHVLSATAEPAPDAADKYAPIEFWNKEVNTERLGMETDIEKFGVDLVMRCIYAIDNTVAYLCGGLRTGPGTLRSVLLRTENGGKTWEEVMPPAPGSAVRCFQMLDNGDGWALTLWEVEGNGEVQVFHTPDYCKTWQEPIEIEKEWYDGYPATMEFTDSKCGKVHMVYDDDTPENARVAILSTEDGGKTWKETDKAPLSTHNEEQMWIDNKTSTGKDGSCWKFERPDSQKSEWTVYRRPHPQAVWRIVSVLPRRYKYDSAGALEIWPE